MKLWVAGLSLVGVVLGAASSFHAARPTVIVLTGDFGGSLEPCGCTTPTTGGILRQVALIRQFQRTSDVTVLANGAVTAKAGRQDQYKLETLADLYGQIPATAINLSHEDARLGPGGLIAVQNISSGKMVSGSVQTNGEATLNPSVVSGSFLIGGVSTRGDSIATSIHGIPVPTSQAVTRLVKEAEQDSLTPILLLDGDQEEATGIAKQFPTLRMIAYRTENEPPAQPVRVGQTWLCTSGEKGKFVTTMTFDGSQFGSYQVVRLGPQIKDDPAASKIYKQYLDRVDGAGFLDQEPRKPSGQFSGSQACAKCHAASYAKWKTTKHYHALADLEKVEHSHDPDCVYCHVVGLNAIGGFRSRMKTPGLADVGCESCHGPGERHVLKPRAIAMPKVGLKMCTSCHTPDQSPDFKSLINWEKIRHR